MKSPERKLRTAFNMIPAMPLPNRVVDDNAIAALRRIPIRLRSCPRVNERLVNAETAAQRIPANPSEGLVGEDEREDDEDRRTREGQRRANEIERVEQVIHGETL